MIVTNKNDQDYVNMTKFTISLLVFILFPYVCSAQVSPEDDFERAYQEALSSSPTQTYSEQKEKTNSSSPRLEASDFSSFMLYYCANFEYLDHGRYGYNGHIFGSFWRYVGISYGIYMDLGINNPSTFGFNLGPNVCIPITRHFYAYAPLLANFMWCNKHFGWTIDLIPSLGLKFGVFTLSAGVDLGWTEGSKKLGTALYAGIALSF